MTENSSTDTASRRAFIAIAVLDLALGSSLAAATQAGLSMVVAITIGAAALFGQMLLWHEFALVRRLSQTGESRVAAILQRRTATHRRGSVRDEVTGLHQRWYLEMRLVEEAERCKRYNHPMAVVVLKAGNVDLSKWSEDGWQSTSLEVARRIAGAVRNVDLSAAIAPMECAICLVHCDREGAEKAVERIRARLPGNCDAGIAVYPDDQCAPEAMIDLARGRSRPLRFAS